MRNKNEPKIRRIISLAEHLPYFRLDNVAGIERNKQYLKILFSRYKKSGKLLCLKRGMYVTKAYIDAIQKSNLFSLYPEFISGMLYEPSYLSLDYVLYEHNLLTEIPVNFTLITKKKTARFTNQFGNFFYHTVKRNLFCGFAILKKGDFTIYKATKAKALFDFLYLRKHAILDRSSAHALRLNIDNVSSSDKKELMGYIKIEGSKKMMEVVNFVFA